MKILIINGPNLNLIGKREPEIYGTETFESFFKKVEKQYPGLGLYYFQSNHEGEIIDKIQTISKDYDGIIINAGAYAHTSIAIADAIRSVQTPIIELHISNVFAREAYRHHSYLTPYCVGTIVGLGMEGYRLGIEYFINKK
jgi:3-dehydroquinate dehydratase II